MTWSTYSVFHKYDQLPLVVHVVRHYTIHGTIVINWLHRISQEHVINKQTSMGDCLIRIVSVFFYTYNYSGQFYLRLHRPAADRQQILQTELV